MKTIIVLSGAGLSAESGIPTFRDSNGLWENHQVEDVASPEGWERDKELVLKFYELRFDAVKNVSPNKAHEALANLEEKYKVIHVTQNIDNLLERAGCADVRHIHGIITRGRCEGHICGCMLDGDPNFKCDYKEELTKAIKLGDKCPKCERQMRPDVVWFGEPVNLPYEETAEWVKEVKYNDGVFICIGTSAQVYPAASLLPFFSQVKNKYIVDKRPKKISDYVLLEGNASEQMPKLAEKLLKLS